MGTVFRIDSYRLAVLLSQALRQRNTDRKKALKIKSIIAYQSLIETYFHYCIKSAILGDSVNMNEAGHIQVLEVISKKNYAWDKKYNGKDWKLIFETSSETIVKFDPKFDNEILKMVDKGKKYNDVSECPEKRLDDLLNLLNGKRGWTKEFKPRGPKGTQPKTGASRERKKERPYQPIIGRKQS